MEKEKVGFDFILPVNEELPHDTFYLLHQDGNSQNLTTFTEVFADNIIRHIVDFLRGCGHYDDVIYGNMRDIADEYFQCEEKKQKAQKPDPEEVDSDSVLG
jgi:hypothetical protein